MALAEHLRTWPAQEITLPWNVPGGPPTTARLIVTSMRSLAVAANDFNRNYWKAALEAAGVPSARYENGLHDLRHFFASALLDQGESLKAVAEWLGHTDPAFTLATYTDLMPSSGDERTKSAIASVYDRRPTGDCDGPTTAQDSTGGEQSLVRPPMRRNRQDFLGYQGGCLITGPEAALTSGTRRSRPFSLSSRFASSAAQSTPVGGCRGGHRITRSGVRRSQA